MICGRCVRDRIAIISDRVGCSRACAARDADHVVAARACRSATSTGCNLAPRRNSGPPAGSDRDVDLGTVIRRRRSWIARRNRTRSHAGPGGMCRVRSPPVPARTAVDLASRGGNHILQRIELVDKRIGSRTLVTAKPMAAEKLSDAGPVGSCHRQGGEAEAPPGRSCGRHVPRDALRYRQNRYN